LETIHQNTTANPAYQEARQLLLAFSAAFKKLKFYSQSHNVYQDALNLLNQLFVEFFKRFGKLRINIEREKIFYDNEMIFEGTLAPGELVFLLHRDGILWVEFQEGLELQEINIFLGILQNHCILEEDAEDDIVTALWEYNLPSILYEAAELEVGMNDDLNIDNLPCCPPKDKNQENITEESIYKASSEMGEPVFCDQSYYTQEKLEALSSLTSEERDLLGKMVCEEEEFDGADYVIDVLLFILEKHALNHDVDDLFGILMEEMRYAMGKLRFVYLHKVLIKIKKYIDAFKCQSHAYASGLEHFYISLSDKTFLTELSNISEQIECCSPDQLKHLKCFLSLFDEKAIITLGHIMVNTPSQKLRQLLLEIIIDMAGRNFQPLEQLIETSDADLTARIVFILRFLNDVRSRQILSRLLQNKSNLIRVQALKAILVRDDDSMDEIFVLIDDPDESIRELILQHLGKKRSEQAEELMLEYLNSGSLRLSYEDHYMAVCRTLGRCGSDRSIPCFKKQIFRLPVLGVPRFKSSIMRRGATCALKELNTQKADFLIERNERGVIKNLFRPV
jgi:hypothetical protein